MSSPKSVSLMGEGRTRTTSQGSDGIPPARRRMSSFGAYTRVVVIGVDTSDHSRYAFEWYLQNIWKSDDLLVLVHCPEAPKLPSFTFKSGINLPVDDWKKILDEMNAKAKALEEDFEATCAQKKLKHKMRIDATNNIGESILRIADEEQADVIICGSRVESGGKYHFKGSTCDFIMRHSSKPVIAVPCLY